MKNVYQIGSGDLTFDIIERIINENLKLELAPEAKDRIQKCRDYLDKKIKESDVPLYGITTGFGSLCNRNISSDELSTLQEPRLQCRRRNAPCHCEADVFIKSSCSFFGTQWRTSHYCTAHYRLFQ